MNTDTVIVGAGPAGLAAAAELGRAGVPAVVLERADAVGAAWRGRYDRLRLQHEPPDLATAGSALPARYESLPDP